ncbi:MAG: hypothetical protein KIG36_03170 [Eubacteriales bacterium]|nr:hypothetical protein [Eubacteriales bacterium]
MKVLKFFVKLITAILAFALAVVIFVLALGLGTLCTVDRILSGQTVSALIASVGSIAEPEKSAGRTVSSAALAAAGARLEKDSDEHDGLPYITRQEYQQAIDKLDLSEMETALRELSSKLPGSSGEPFITAKAVKGFLSSVDIETAQKRFGKIMDDESVQSFIESIDKENTEKNLPALLTTSLFGDVIGDVLDYYIGNTAAYCDPLRTNPDPEQAKLALTESLTKSLQNNIGDLSILIGRDLTAQEKENLCALCDDLAVTVADALPSSSMLFESISKDARLIVAVLLSSTARIALGVVIFLLLALISLLRWSWHRGFIWTGIPLLMVGLFFATIGLTGNGLVGFLPESMTKLAGAFQPIGIAFRNVGLIMSGVGVVLIILFIIGSILMKNRRAKKAAATAAAAAPAAAAPNGVVYGQDGVTQIHVVSDTSPAVPSSEPAPAAPDATPTAPAPAAAVTPASEPVTAPQERYVDVSTLDDILPPTDPQS